MVMDNIGSHATPAQIKQAIADHEARVDLGQCSRSTCPACQGGVGFARKDVRRRKLRFFDHHPTTGQSIVATVTLRLARFRCITCKYVMTDYPDFRTPL